MALFSDTQPRYEDSSNTSLKKINQILHEGGGGGGGTTEVKVVESILPTGAATEAKQDDQITEAQTIQELITDLKSLQFGLWGTEIKEGEFSGAVTGNYFAIKAWTDISILDLTLGAGHTGAGVLIGFTIPAGEILYANITSIEFEGLAQLFKLPST